ncbi:MAG: class A beta-lactamase [Pseudomonadota bacterium]
MDPIVIDRLTRRTILLGLSGTVWTAACSPAQQGEAVDETVPKAALTDPIVDIEDATGGKIGVAAVNLASGQRFEHRGEDRHAMCSTFKWVLAGLVLYRADRGEESLNRTILIEPDAVLPYAPVTGPGVGTTMAIDALCRAAVVSSDNTAANLLLDTMGGPRGFTSSLRGLGDTVTRLDRSEPALNENADDDPRDTTTPLAMLALMEAFLFGDTLSEKARQRLRGWMQESTTGLRRLRAGLPRDWIAGDKTGTSLNDQTNNVAFAIDPTGATGPLLVVSFMNVPEPTADERDFAHAAIARGLSDRLR